MKRMFTLKRVWTLELSDQEFNQLLRLLSFVERQAGEVGTGADGELELSRKWLEGLDKSIKEGEVQES